MATVCINRFMPSVQQGKQCSLRSDAAQRSVGSGSTLFALNTGISIRHGNNKNYTDTPFIRNGQILFVCVEVLRASQPNGVMSSAVSLPNHIFTEQA